MMKNFFLSFALTVSVFCLTTQAEAVMKLEPIKKDELASLQTVM
jgi:hypothetical protein